MSLALTNRLFIQTREFERKKTFKLDKKDLIRNAENYIGKQGLIIVNKHYRTEMLEIFTDAFKHDPLPEYVTGIGTRDLVDEKKSHSKDLMMKFMFDWVNIDVITKKNGIVLGIRENDGLVGAVSIVPSKLDKSQSFIQMVRKAIKLGIPPTETSAYKQYFHSYSSKRLERLDDITTRRLQIMKERGFDRYIYIQTIGVKTSHQGKGIGGKLLRTIFEMAASTNSICYLETETKENVSLYNHLGFQTVDELKINVPGDDAVLTMYCMLRA